MTTYDTVGSTLLSHSGIHCFGVCFHNQTAYRLVEEHIDDSIDGIREKKRTVDIQVGDGGKVHTKSTRYCVQQKRCDGEK